MEAWYPASPVSTKIACLTAGEADEHYNGASTLMLRPARTAQAPRMRSR